MTTETIDLAPGLWLWRTPHPDWQEGVDWDPLVTSTVIESRGEVIVLDGLAPPPAATEVWHRLEARPPTAAVVVKADHVRDIDLFARWYGAKPYGPYLYWKGDVPHSELVPVRPGDELPGGLVALYDARWGNETPIWAPDHRTIVFADALTERDGELLVWGTPWHERWVVPVLREYLELPFERVIISHGSPVHDRAAFERALELPPFTFEQI
jgi:hypothetical protein